MQKYSFIIISGFIIIIIIAFFNPYYFLYANEHETLPIINGPNLQRDRFQNKIKLKHRHSISKKELKKYKETPEQEKQLNTEKIQKEVKEEDVKLQSLWEESITLEHQSRHEIELAPKKEKIQINTKTEVNAEIENNFKISFERKDIPNTPPDYYEGLYINNGNIIYHPKKYISLIEKAKLHGINTLVVDVQPRMPLSNLLIEAKKKGFHLVARIVVFPGGLKSYPPSEKKINRIYHLIEECAKMKFDEIQLDYIRFADAEKINGLTLSQRYQFLEKILGEVKQRLEKYGIPWGADLFGRIAFNHDDRIGQKLEIFAKYTDTLYPMLYPSHFYGMPKKIRDPYSTVLAGIKNSIKRTQNKVRVIAYIQAFKMKITPSKLSYTDYIYQQLRASEHSKGSGYIAWNARNNYTPFFKAITKYRNLHVHN